MKSVLAIGLLFLGINARASYPDGTKWSLVNKSCDSTALIVQKNERIQFANGYYVHVQTVSEDQNQICNEGLVYLRIIQSTSGAQGTYHEQATLSPNARKSQCNSKANGSIITSNTSGFSGKNETASMSLGNTDGLLNITGSEECPAGILHLKLSLK